MGDERSSSFAAAFEQERSQLRGIVAMVRKEARRILDCVIARAMGLRKGTAMQKEVERGVVQKCEREEEEGKGGKGGAQCPKNPLLVPNSIHRRIRRRRPDAAEQSKRRRLCRDAGDESNDQRCR